nr:UPF0481 protein At3g47200-like [Ipomoea batatas]
MLINRAINGIHSLILGRRSQGGVSKLKDPTIPVFFHPNFINAIIEIMTPAPTTTTPVGPTATRRLNNSTTYLLTRPRGKRSGGGWDAPFMSRHLVRIAWDTGSFLSRLFTDFISVLSDGLAGDEHPFTILAGGCGEDVLESVSLRTVPHSSPFSGELLRSVSMELAEHQDQEQDDVVKPFMDMAELIHKMGSRGIDNGQAIEISGAFQDYPWKRNFYKPSFVSIGPKYSKEVDQVKDREYKKMYLKSFLKRAAKYEEYKKIVENPELMGKAKHYYEETAGIAYPQDDEELVEMLVLDGCFVVEFVLKCKEGGNGDPRRSIDGKKAREDMLLFENQLPFEILTAIYQKTIAHISGEVPSFIRLVKFSFASLAPNFTFYNFYDDNLPEKPMNLLHVVHSLCVPNVNSHRIEVREAEGDIDDVTNKWLTLNHINTATELQEVGVGFKNTGEIFTMPKEYAKIPAQLKENKEPNDISLFDITFSSGEMRIPCFKVDNSTELFFRNMIALEQQCCQVNPKYYTDYARLMSHLVKGNKDITFLRKNGTIHNLLGEDGKVAYMFNNLSVEIDTSTNFYFASVYTAVNGLCRNRRHVWKQKLKEFFYVLWKGVTMADVGGSCRRYRRSGQESVPAIRELLVFRLGCGALDVGCSSHISNEDDDFVDGPGDPMCDAPDIDLTAKELERTVLGTRGVETTGECCLCEAAAETIEHLFCNCPVVSQLWNGFEEFLGGTLVSVLERFLGSTIPLKAIEMAARLWVIWSARNDKLWNAKVCNFDDLLRTVDIYVSSWTQAYVLPPGLMSVAPNTVVNVWCAPPFGYLKCNVDASLAGDVSGFGAVIRDHAGRKLVTEEGKFFLSDWRSIVGRDGNKRNQANQRITKWEKPSTS